LQAGVPFGAFQASASHEHEIKITGCNEIAQPARRFVPELPLRIALCTPSLGCVEANESHVWLLMVDADGVTVHNAHLVGLDRFGANNALGGYYSKIQSDWQGRM
jgi:hypothetical protein